MIDKNIFLNNFYSSKKSVNKNLSKTKKVFKLFKTNLENLELPFLESYEKNYLFSFSTQTFKKFSKYKNIVIIGMGGSILGAKTIYSFFRNKIKKEVFFFDNLDINLHSQFSKIKNLKNSCFVVISKSGNTLETITNFSLIFSKTLLRNKLIFITELKDNCLIDIANKFNAEIIGHKEYIEGRYSVFSEAGMFPAALMGLNINRFKNFKKLIKNKTFVSALIKNVATIYTLYSSGVKNSVILSYDSNLNDLGCWYQQLTGESTGKKQRGITPILSSSPRDHHSLFQLYLDGPRDKFFTFFSSQKIKSKNKISNVTIPDNMKFIKNKNIGSIVNAQCNAAKNIFKLKSIPFRSFIFNKNDEKELGMVFTFLVLETILLGYLMNINPFSQPAVEQIKKETKKILSR